MGSLSQELIHDQKWKNKNTKWKVVFTHFDFWSDQFASLVLRYRGPELEMWSLGITLYTLIFGENPFFDVEETLQGVLKPPTRVSRGWFGLLTGC